jgi:hypothetical protein
MRRRAPELAHALEVAGHPPPRRIDRIYDSTRAAARLGYEACHDVLELLTADAAGS